MPFTGSLQLPPSCFPCFCLVPLAPRVRSHPPLLIDPPELPSAHFSLGFIYSPSPLPQLQPSGPAAVALTLLASVFPGPGVPAPTYPQARSLASFRCHPFRGTFLDWNYLQLPSALFPISWNTLLSLPAVFVPEHSARSMHPIRSTELLAVSPVQSAFCLRVRTPLCLGRISASRTTAGMC